MLSKKKQIFRQEKSQDPRIHDANKKKCEQKKPYQIFSQYNSAYTQPRIKSSDIFEQPLKCPFFKILASMSAEHYDYALLCYKKAACRVNICLFW